MKKIRRYRTNKGLCKKIWEICKSKSKKNKWPKKEQNDRPWIDSIKENFNCKGKNKSNWQLNINIISIKCINIKFKFLETQIHHHLSAIQTQLTLKDLTPIFQKIFLREIEKEMLRKAAMIKNCSNSHNKFIKWKIRSSNKERCSKNN